VYGIRFALPTGHHGPFYFLITTTAYDDAFLKRGVWAAFFQHRRMHLGVLGWAICMHGMEKFLFPFSLNSQHRESLLTSSHTEVSVDELRCGGLTSRSTSSCRREAIMQHISQMK
jgi:hypothetical protein